MRTALHSELINRFGEHRVLEIPSAEGEFPLLILDLELSSPVSVLMTNGLSDYKMPVPEKHVGEEYNELYFCLPNYWDWEDVENPNLNWTYTWLRKMAAYVIEKNTWFGEGHIIPNGKDRLAISTNLKQNHFLLCEPILLERELEVVQLGDKRVNFLAVVPIFQDEMDYKEARGTFKFLQKMDTANINEKLDEFRSSVLKSKWRLKR